MSRSLAVSDASRDGAGSVCAGLRANASIRRIVTDGASSPLPAAAALTAAIRSCRGAFGWLIYQGLLALILHNSDISLPREFPPAVPLITLAGLLVLTLLTIRGPLHRATRIQPGTALRYQ